MEGVIFSGCLLCWVRGLTRKHWQRRFYVLRRAGAGGKARIDYYDDHTSFKRSPKNHKTIFLDKLKYVRGIPWPGQQHCFEIVISDAENSQTLVFATDSQAQLDDWLLRLKAREYSSGATGASYENTDSLVDSIVCNENAVYEPSGTRTEGMYQVTVLETEAAKRANLVIGQVYDLYVLPENLVLITPERRAISWGYKHIRRYGLGDGVFTFEGGRKCTLGEGRFSFKVKCAEEFYEDVRMQMKGLQTGKSSQSSQSDQINPTAVWHASPLSPRPDPPPVPPIGRYVDVFPLPRKRVASYEEPCDLEIEVAAPSTPVYSVPYKPHKLVDENLTRQPPGKVDDIATQLQRTEFSPDPNYATIAAADMTSGGQTISDLVDQVQERQVPPSELYDHINMKKTSTDTGSSSAATEYGRLQPP